GFFRPTPGGVYPILRNLEKLRYIKGEWGTQRNRKIKVYKITERGRQILKNAMIKQSEIAKNLNSLAEEFAREVLNMETEKIKMPIMPGPFDLFLVEGKETKNIEALEKQRAELKRHINIFLEKLKSVDKEIEKTKKDKQIEK
ncbi:MAG: hypothetical protein GX638_06460, partial [Crenarchaeota archaeon]|nr:hypothetical protein [Thermoproteota archaeon]